MNAHVRIAAAGDVHIGEHNHDVVASAFREVAGGVDAILLAGDLTTHGEPAQGALLADVCRDLDTPVVAVLGNHDLHAGRRAELVAALRDGGIQVLDPGDLTCAVNGSQLGIAGAKGFVGGFHGHGLPDFGEPSLRAVYAETSAEVEALDEGLAAISLCPFRIALLHYAPVAETLHGEPPQIWTFLGSDRLAPPILEHRPDLVLHGHAHSGTFAADLDGVPVHNVSVPLMGRDFWVFELTGHERIASPIR